MVGLKSKRLPKLLYIKISAANTTKPLNKHHHYRIDLFTE